MTGTAAIWRRSIGVPLVPILAAIIAVNVLLRDTGWTREWLWAIYNYHFVTVLIGPVVAGAAAWEGARYHPTRATTIAANQPLRPLATIWGALTGWVVGVYLVGLAAVLAVAAVGPAPGWPEPAALLTVLPALGLLSTLAAAGLALGWRYGHRLLAPIVGLVTFVGIIGLYATTFGNFVTVGGATASLAASAPRLTLTTTQTVTFAALTLAVLMFASIDPAVPRRLSRTVTALAALAACAALLAAGEPFETEPADIHVVCEGDGPTICVHGGYTSFIPDIRAALEPMLAAADAAGAPTPPTFTQGPPDADAAELPHELIVDGDPHAAAASIVDYWTGVGCDPFATDDAFSAFQDLSLWLTYQVLDPTADVLDDDVLGPPTAEQRAWVADQLAALKTAPCGS